ncbi:MAG: TonB-dependent receptor [Parahaliea sp.]
MKPRVFAQSLPTLSTLAVAVIAASQAAAQLEEVVVTAQKVQQSMQEVPIAVTALTGASLAQQNITNIEGMSNSLPNVQINHFSNSPDSAVFTIRGVGVNDADPYVGTTVSVVVDGVVVGVNTNALQSLFDIERVEILRGPQGTLFGANTTGGVVNVITKQPTGELGGEVQVNVGNFDRLELNGAVNFPITEQLAGKISLLHTEQDGYFKNYLNGDDLGSVDTTSLRGYLKYEKDDYNATLIAEYGRFRNGSQTNRNISSPSMVLYLPGQTSDEPIYRRGQNAGFPDQNDKDVYALTLTQNWSTNSGDWVSITSYREYDQDLYSDDDATTEQLLQTNRTTDHWQFTQEIRDSFELGERLRMTAGAFYLQQEYELNQETMLDGFGRGTGQPQRQEQENWSASVFAQAYYSLSDALTLQAGVRYAYEETEALSLTSISFTATPGSLSSFDDPVIPSTVVIAEGEESWGEVGYKLGLDYQLNDDVMVYGYYARGFKSGGFTGRIVVAQDIGPFDPEFLDTFEIGVKADLFERRVRANLAVFYNEYQDMQVTQNVTYPNGNNSASVQNAGEASSSGAELEITAYATDNLVFNLAAAYLDAQYDEYDTTALDPVSGVLETISFAGNPLMNAPRWSGNVSANYTLPIAGGEADFFAQVTHSSEKVSNYTAYPEEVVGEITLVNAKISWQPDSGKWGVGIYGRNLTDKEYFLQKQWYAPTFGIAALGTPREYGIDFNYNW